MYHFDGGLWSRKDYVFMKHANEIELYSSFNKRASDYR